MKRLAYVLVPKNNVTQVTVLASLDVPQTENRLVLRLAMERSPLDWCYSLAKAAAAGLENNGTYKTERTTADTRPDSQTPHTNYV